VKKKPKNREYLILAFPENPLLFGIARLAEENEKFLSKDPDGKEHGAVYDSLVHVVSPFIDPLTGEKGEWCSCLHWKTRGRRCVHLKKFFEANPNPSPPPESPSGTTTFLNTVLPLP